MVRDPGWRFMDAGRRIERGIQLGDAAAGHRHRSTHDHGDRQPHARVGADRGREHHHLPPPLPVPGPDRDGARPPAARRGQPAVAGLPARPPRRGRRRRCPAPAAATGRQSEAERAAPRAAPRSPAGRHRPRSPVVGDDRDAGRELVAFLDRRSSAASTRSPTPSTPPTSPTSCPQRSVLPADPARPREWLLVTYRVTHRTEYRYEATVSSSYGEAHLLPARAAGPGVPLDASSPSSRPRSTTASAPTSSATASPTSPSSSPTRRSTVTATSEVDVIGRQATLRLLGDQPWEQVARRRLRRDADRRGRSTPASTSLDSPLGRRVGRGSPAYAAPSFAPGRPSLERVGDLTARIHARLRATRPGATTVTPPSTRCSSARAGVCQDFAHLAIGCLRVARARRPLRERLPRDVPPPGRPRLRRRRRVARLGRRCSCPGAAGSTLDPTNDQFVDDRYVTVGWGRDYATSRRSRA